MQSTCHSSASSRHASANTRHASASKRHAHKLLACAMAFAAGHTPQCLPQSAAPAIKKHTPVTKRLLKRLPKRSRECERNPFRACKRLTHAFSCFKLVVDLPQRLAGVLHSRHRSTCCNHQRCVLQSLDFILHPKSHDQLLI